MSSASKQNVRNDIVAIRNNDIAGSWAQRGKKKEIARKKTRNFLNKNAAQRKKEEKDEL